MKNVDLLLINPPFHRRNGSGTIFPLGLGYIISSVNQEGFTCRVVDCTQMISTYKEDDLCILKESVFKELKEYNPLLVGIGPCITTQVKALQIIAECCLEMYESNRIFAGGPLASIDGQEWFFFDFLKIEYIVRGDGEEAICKMLNCIKNGQCIADCDCVTRRGHNHFNEIENIDGLSFPKRLFIFDNIISIRRRAEDTVRTASMITSRGCVYNCRYCVSGNMKYKKFRKRSNIDIVNEMEYLFNHYKITDIIFYDDCFFYNSQKVHQEIEEFCNTLINRKISMTWQMEIRCDLFLKLNNEDIKLLEKAGCRQVNLGIEKTYVAGLEALGKNIPLNGLAEQILKFKKITNIKVAGTFILGGKSETERDIKGIIENSTKLHLDYAHYNPLFIYPGTPLYQEYFKDEKEWVDYILKDNWPWGEVVYENEYINREQLICLVDYAYEKFYFDSPYRNDIMIKDRFNLN